MKILCVAEKPSIAKSIASILASGHPTNRPGKDKYCRNYDFQYRLPGVAGMVDMTMTSVRGHLTNADFGPEHKNWRSCDPSSLFEAPIITDLSSDAKAIGQNLRLEARGADALMIWTDCDREGEHIGAEIVTEVRKVRRNIRVMRAHFSAIIDSQIHRAAQNTVELDWKAADAVASRIELDLRIGAAFTRLQTMALQTRIPALGEEKQVISYGPCQFPTLGFVVDRYKKVLNFVPEPFWLLQVHKTRSMAGGDPSADDPPDDVKKVVFSWDRVHLFDKKAVEIFRDGCRANLVATVEAVTNKQTKKFKPYPLTTVELQKSGSRLLRLAPKKVLDIAESLYQKGFLSYPRTETDQYDKEFDFNTLIAKQTADGAWGGIAQRLLDGDFDRPRNGKNNDKAHPPIHPTSHANGLTGDDKRVYDYVVRRFLASCWRDAIGTQTTVRIDIAGEKFHASGLVILQRNYLEVFTYDKWDGTLLPPFVEGESFVPTKLEMKSGSTSPPKLLTEADLVNLMDKNGIGTDATIAEHIAKVIERRYVMQVKEGKTTYLVPSTLGIGLVEGYNELNLEKSLSKPLLRRETEFRMALICAGERGRMETIQESVEEYREVFAVTSREFDRIAQTVLRYLTDPNAGQEARAVELLERDDEDEEGQESDGASDDDDFGGGGDGGGGAGRATATSTRGRSRGRGAASTSTSTRGARGGRSNGTTRPQTAKPDDDMAGGASYGTARPRGGAATSSRTTTANGTCHALQCLCGDTAAERMTNKAGANQGRKFYACPKPMGDSDKCDFFQWADDTSTPSTGSRSTTTIIPSKRSGGGGGDEWASHLRGSDHHGSRGSGVRRCDCDLTAERKSVTKAGPNQGRAFWACGRESVRLRCKFFEWEDEAPGPPNTNLAKNGGGACYRCGQEGHWASDCTGPQQSNTGRGPTASKRGRGRGGKKTTGGGKDGGCFRCGQQGHWSSECPGS